MKTLLIAAFLVPFLLLAQDAPQPLPARPLPQPQPIRQRVVSQPGMPMVPTGEVLADNYELRLTITDKDVEPLEVTLVVASPQFKAVVTDKNLNFSGTLAVEESGELMIGYAIGWETPFSGAGGNVQFRTSSMTGSVRLKAGDEVQILRAGTHATRLAIRKVEPAKAK
jgi:hypothetical protein